MRKVAISKAERGIEDQQHCDDTGLDKFADPDLQKDRSLEHPGNRGPELTEGTPQRVLGNIDDRVGTALRQEQAGGLARQPVRCIRDGSSRGRGDSGSEGHRLSADDDVVLDGDRTGSGPGRSGSHLPLMARSDMARQPDSTTFRAHRNCLRIEEP